MVPLTSLLRSSRVEADVDEELRYHVEREIERRVASGLLLEEARCLTLPMNECLRLSTSTPGLAGALLGRPVAALMTGLMLLASLAGAAKATRRQASTSAVVTGR